MKASDSRAQDWQIECFYKMLAKVYRLALKEALRGKQASIDWLDCTLPDWRELHQREQRIAKLYEDK